VRAPRQLELGRVLASFSDVGYRSAVPGDPQLTPATTEDIEQALAFALRFDGRRRVHNGDEFMARIMAERLVKHLELCGFVVMKKPPIGDSNVPPGRKRTDQGCNSI